jgi:hypothetical protein
MQGIGPIWWPLALSRPLWKVSHWESMLRWVHGLHHQSIGFSCSASGPTLVSTQDVHMWHLYNPMWSIGATRWWNLLSGWHQIVLGISRIMPLEQAHLTATMWQRVHVWHQIKERSIGVSVWWPVTCYGAPGTVIGGLRQKQNLIVNAKTAIYTGSGRLDSVTPYIQLGVWFCVGLLCMIGCIRGALASLCIV